MRRLTTVRDTRRGPQDLSPVTQPVPSEMAPLVGSLNRLMSRLDHTLTQSEDFIAEAAHRIRTPLATVRSHAEATLQRVEHRPRIESLCRPWCARLTKAAALRANCLDHAMVTFRAESLELSQDRAGRPVARPRPKHVTRRRDERHFYRDGTRRPCELLQGDAILLQNALRNLIDNALKYAPVETSCHRACL